MYETDRETSPPMGEFVLVDEAGNAAIESFHADDAARVARFLSRWSKELLRLSAEGEAGEPLLGDVTQIQHAVGPLRAQILIPDENGNTAEWRFETSPGNVQELADWLVAVGKWNRRPSTGKEAPSGLVGPDSESEPEVFASTRAAVERDLALAAQLLATAPARGGRKRESREAYARLEDKTIDKTIRGEMLAALTGLRDKADESHGSRVDRDSSADQRRTCQ